MPDTPDHPEDATTDEPLSGRKQAQRELDGFRRRVDEFWSDPRTAELRQRYGSGPLRINYARSFRPRWYEPGRAMRWRRDPIRRRFAWRRASTYRDGQLVSISGDDRPLAPDERILVVTTTTTLVDSDSVAVETDVLVFEREE